MIFKNIQWTSETRFCMKALLEKTISILETEIPWAKVGLLKAFPHGYL